ncbi:FAD/NAD(P)-binding domain-containing protein [Mycena epipterygia]|nr:FAD/NAD(P)-binding domain-containing protein [Mycena epipterygia]KAJ7123509.1 FAD/NAD(P)-binding domain-containing protein [Mycena epipterygia]
MSAAEPLRVIVVGAGLGGLAAAVSFRRQGHRVEIFESSLMNKEIGAAITIQANGLRVLEYLGYENKNLKGVEFLGSAIFSSLGGEGRTSVRPSSEINPIARLGWFCHRADLHDELKRLAIGEDGAGPPAFLHLGQEVASCDPVEGVLRLKNGQTHEADLIVGADGIHSVIRTSVLGYPQTALASGVSSFRFMFEASRLEGLPEMEWFCEGISGARIVSSPQERFHMLFLSSCREGRLINVVAHHADDRDLDKHEWSVMADVTEVLNEFKGFHHRYLKFLEQAEQPILRWQLRVLPLLPTWINGLTTLLGDAAHGTLPTLGQGAGMALEDAAAIGCLIPLGTTREDIPARLQAYQELRKPRGEFVNRESLAVTQPARRIQGRPAENRWQFLVDYDAVETAQKYHREHFL